MRFEVSSSHTVSISAFFLGEDALHSSLLQHGVPRQSSKSCSSVAPLQSHKSCQQTYSGVDFTLHRAIRPVRACFTSHGITASIRHLPALAGAPWDNSPYQTSSLNHLLCHGVLQGLQVDLCSTVEFLGGVQGHSCLTMVGTTVLQGDLCFGAWSTSLPSFCPALGVSAGLLLSLIPTSPSDCNCCHTTLFPPLKPVVPEILPLLLMGSEVAGSRFMLEPAAFGSLGHGRSF